MKQLSRLLLGICVGSVLLLSAACTSKPAAEPLPSSKPQEEGVKLRIDGDRLVPDITRTISINESDKPNLRQLLQSSGIIVLNEAQTEISSVGEISLDNGLSWAVKVNDVEYDPALWGKRMSSGEQVLVYLKGHDGTSVSALNPVVLNISGGLSNPGLQYYFVNMFQDNLTVRDVLQRSGLVQIADQNQLVRAVNGLTGNINEEWIVKLNNKKLLQSGLDIRLQPSDKLEVVLSQI